jgi:GWxTD domain-containing protein
VGPSGFAEAIDLGGTEPAAETYEDADLLHLQYVLDAKASSAYPKLSAAERQEILRLVWASLDPTPTTERNERKLAHYQRLAYAREHFAIPQDPGWDRRGELLLRYGPPQVRQIIAPDIVPVFGFVPAKEVWGYPWLGMSFRMADAMLRGDFQEDAGRTHSSRPDFAYGTGSLDAGTSSSLADVTLQATAEADAFRRQKELGKGLHALDERTHAFRLDDGGERLDYVFETLDFAGRESNRTRLEVNFQIDAASLSYQPVGDREVAEIDVEVAAKTMDYREVERTRHTLRNEAQGRGSRVLVVLDQAVLELEPGDYRLALSVRDTHSGDVGVFTSVKRVRDLSPGQLRISDLQIASAVQVSRTGHRFSKGEYFVVPNPTGVVRQGSPLFVYFEIYGLGLSPTGTALYTIELSVGDQVDGKSDGGSASRVSTEYMVQGRSRTAQESLGLESSDLAAGRCVIEIEVRDLVADRAASGVVTMEIIEAASIPLD